MRENGAWKRLRICEGVNRNNAYCAKREIGLHYWSFRGGRDPSAVMVCAFWESLPRCPPRDAGTGPISHLRLRRATLHAGQGVRLWLRRTCRVGRRPDRGDAPFTWKLWSRVYCSLVIRVLPVGSLPKSSYRRKTMTCSSSGRSRSGRTQPAELRSNTRRRRCRQRYQASSSQIWLSRRRSIRLCWLRGPPSLTTCGHIQRSPLASVPM